MLENSKAFFPDYGKAKRIKMDNQQAIERTLTTEDLAWLGGVIDGEGCISLTKRLRHKGKVNYKPYIVISNSDPGFVEEISKVLNMAEIGNWVIWQKSEPKKLSKRHLCNVTISGFMRCKSMLKIMMPFIRAKNDQAKLMLEYIEYRLEIGKDTKNSYTVKDDEYYAEMHNLKQKRASETTRGSRYISSNEKI